MCMLLPAHTSHQEASQQQREALQLHVQGITPHLSLAASEKDLLVATGSDPGNQPTQVLAEVRPVCIWRTSQHMRSFKTKCPTAL